MADLLEEIRALRAANTQWISPNDNVDARANLDRLRRCCRVLAKTNPYFTRYLAAMVDSVVGSEGVRLTMTLTDKQGKPKQKLNDDIEKAWEQFSTSHIDTRESLDLTGLLQWAVRSLIRDGEAFVHWGVDHMGDIRVTPFEGDLVDERVNDMGSGWRLGVRTSPTGVPMEYALMKRARDDVENITDSGYWTSLSAEQTLHVFRPGQSDSLRGIPWARPVLGLMEDIDQLEKNVLRRNTAISLHPYFLESVDPKAANLTGKRSSLDPTPDAIKFGTDPTVLVPVPKNTKIVAPPLEHHQAGVQEFLVRLLHKLASALGMSFVTLTGDFSEVNYSSSRSARLLELATFEGVVQILVTQLLNPLFLAWLRHHRDSFPQLSKEIYDKLHNHQGFVWNTKNLPVVDEQKTITAQKTALECGLTTRTEILAQQGLSFNDLVAVMQQEKAALEAADLSMPGPTYEEPEPPEMMGEGPSRPPGRDNPEDRPPNREQSDSE